MKLPKDHIYVILFAFLAALGCFTAVTIVGTDPSSTATLRDVVIGLAGALGGVAYGSARGSSPTE